MKNLFAPLLFMAVPFSVHAKSPSCDALIGSYAETPGGQAEMTIYKKDSRYFLHAGIPGDPSSEQNLEMTALPASDPILKDLYTQDPNMPGSADNTCALKADPYLFIKLPVGHNLPDIGPAKTGYLAMASSKDFAMVKHLYPVAGNDASPQAPAK